MGHLVRFEENKSLVVVFDIHDCVTILRECVGNDVADYLESEICALESERDESIKQKEELEHQLEDMDDVYADAQNELEDLEEQLCDAETLLTDICSRIVTATKLEEEVDLSEIVKKICKHKNAVTKDFDI